MNAINYIIMQPVGRCSRYHYHGFRWIFCLTAKSYTLSNAAAENQPINEATKSIGKGPLDMYTCTCQRHLPLKSFQAIQI